MSVPNGTWCSNRMTESNGSSTDVNLALVHTQVFHDGQRLGRKRLIQLEHIDIVNNPSRFRKLEIM